LGIFNPLGPTPWGILVFGIGLAFFPFGGVLYRVFGSPFGALF